MNSQNYVKDNTGEKQQVFLEMEQLKQAGLGALSSIGHKVVDSIDSQDMWYGKTC